MRLAWVAVGLVLLGGTAAAQEADMAQLELGMRLFKDALTQADGGAGCELCHNWNGVGRQHNMLYLEVMPAGGNDLTKSTMSREQMIEMVACGRFSGAGLMPNYRNDAWSTGYPCYGKTRADNPEERPPQPGMRQLAPREVEAVVDYVRAVYQGKSMSLAWCLKWFGTSSKGCDTWATVAR